MIVQLISRRSQNFYPNNSHLIENVRKQQPVCSLDVKNFGYKPLTVEYKKQIHHLKLPYCCAGACEAFEASDPSSGSRIKSQIQSLMNNSQITYDNQIWKIKDSKQNNQIVTLNPTQSNDIDKLWKNGNGYLILSIK